MAALVVIFGTYPAIQAAVDAASPGDAIEITNAYSNETANVTVDNLTFDGQADSTGIQLDLANGAAIIVLTGTAPINAADGNAGDDITGASGSDAVSVTRGVGRSGTVDGGSGTDTPTVDDSGAWNRTTATSAAPIQTRGDGRTGTPTADRYCSTPAASLMVNRVENFNLAGRPG